MQITELPEERQVSLEEVKGRFGTIPELDKRRNYIILEDSLFQEGRRGRKGLRTVVGDRLAVSLIRKRLWPILSEILLNARRGGDEVLEIAAEASTRIKEAQRRND